MDSVEPLHLLGGKRVTAKTDKLADLERRLELVELYLDSDMRERRGVTVDQIREIWRAQAAHAPTKEAKK